MAAMAGRSYLVEVEATGKVVACTSLAYCTVQEWATDYYLQQNFSPSIDP